MAGIYIHIPFCKSRCIYCDFYSTTEGEKMKEYVHALTRELTLRADFLKKDGVFPNINTVYIGGGTPSTLSTTCLRQIFECIYKVYPVVEDAEITIEANPDDLDNQRIEDWRKLPINRISMGIQTFNDERLKLLHRRHNGQQAINAVRACQNAGFGNISIDLIYGLPGQTLADWESDLSQAIELQTQHISAYSLTYEEKTPIWKMRERHIVKEADETLSLKMFEMLSDKLATAGFEHYEISNFSRKGFRSRHNSSYWDGTPYLGCGPAAHSFDGQDRQWNIPDLNLYIKAMQDCTKEDFQDAPWIRKEHLSKSEQYNDCIITALRTSQGINLHQLRRRFGKKLADYCLQNAKPHINRGTLEIADIKEEQTPEGLLKLTRKGIFLSDDIMCDLLYVDN